jgi:hypothetical protein
MMVAGLVVVVLVVVGLVVFFVRSRASMVPAPLRQALEQAGFQRSQLRDADEERWDRADALPLRFKAKTRKGVLRYTVSCDEDPSALEWLRPFLGAVLTAEVLNDSPPQGDSQQLVSESPAPGLQLSVRGEGTSLSPAEVEQLLALGRPLAPQLRKLPEGWFSVYFHPADKSEATGWFLEVQWRNAATAAELSAALSLVSAITTALRSQT